MNIPENLLYTKEHEWAKVEGDIAVIGITDYAQASLGDITFVELPKPSLELKQFDFLATIESVKAASDIYLPLSGKVFEVNTKVENDPGLVNRSCYQDGWIAKVKIKDSAEKKNLMDAAAYKRFLEGLTP